MGKLVFLQAFSQHQTDLFALHQLADAAEDNKGSVVFVIISGGLS